MKRANRCVQTPSGSKRVSGKTNGKRPEARANDRIWGLASIAFGYPSKCPLTAKGRPMPVRGFTPNTPPLRSHLTPGRHCDPGTARVSFETRMTLCSPWLYGAHFTPGSPATTIYALCRIFCLMERCFSFPYCVSARPPSWKTQSDKLRVRAEAVLWISLLQIYGFHCYRENKGGFLYIIYDII